MRVHYVSRIKLHSNMDYNYVVKPTIYILDFMVLRCVTMSIWDEHGWFYESNDGGYILVIYQLY